MPLLTSEKLLCYLSQKTEDTKQFETEMGEDIFAMAYKLPEQTLDCWIAFLLRRNNFISLIVLCKQDKVKFVGKKKKIFTLP